MNDASHWVAFVFHAFHGLDAEQTHLYLLTKAIGVAGGVTLLLAIGASWKFLSTEEDDSMRAVKKPTKFDAFMSKFAGICMQPSDTASMWPEVVIQQMHMHVVPGWIANGERFYFGSAQAEQAVSPVGYDREVP